MSDVKKPNPILKLLLEIGPIAIFFMAYNWAPVPEGATDSEAQLEQIVVEFTHGFSAPAD